MIDGIWLVGERYLIFELAIYYLMQFNSWLSININETWMQKTQKGVRVYINFFSLIKKSEEPAPSLLARIPSLVRAFDIHFVGVLWETLVR